MVVVIVYWLGIVVRSAAFNNVLSRLTDVLGAQGWKAERRFSSSLTVDQREII